MNIHREKNLAREGVPINFHWILKLCEPLNISFKANAIKSKYSKINLKLLCTTLMKINIFILLIAISTNSISNENNIKIATLDYPPFIYQDGGIEKGIVLDIVVAAFHKLNVNVEIEFYPVKRGLEMVKDGRVDAYFSLKKTPERIETLLFTTKPLVQQKFVVFTLIDKEINYTGKIEDLSTYSIGVECNTSYGNIVDNAIKGGILKNVDCAQSFEFCIKKLLAGRTDIIINSLDVGNELIAKMNKTGLVKSLNPPIETLSSYLAFTKVRDYSTLAESFDNVLSEMIKDGTVEKIKSKYTDKVSIGY